jgi:hypothetical protein
MEESLDSFGGNPFLLEDEVRTVVDADSSFGVRTGMAEPEKLRQEIIEPLGEEIRSKHKGLKGTWRRLVALLLFAIVAFRLVWSLLPLERPLLKVV